MHGTQAAEFQKKNRSKSRLRMISLSRDDFSFLATPTLPQQYSSQHIASNINALVLQEL